MVKEIIVDFDGTLTNESIGDIVEERGIEWNDYRLMDVFISNFKPKPGIKILWEAGIKPVIITGRQESLRDVSVEWLKVHRVPFKELVMVPDGYYGGAFDWKKYVDYKLYAHRQYDVRFSLDDNKSLVSILKNSEIPAFLVTDNFDDAFVQAWERTDP